MPKIDNTIVFPPKPKSPKVMPKRPPFYSLPQRKWVQSESGWYSTQWESSDLAAYDQKLRIVFKYPEE